MKLMEKAKDVKEKLADLLKDFYKDSHDFLLEAHNKSKDLSKTNYELGKFHLAKGNLYDATMRFKMLNLLKDGYEDVLYLLGRCYQYNFKITQAIESYSKFLQQKQDVKVEYRLKLLKKESIYDIPKEVIEEDFDFFSFNSEYEGYNKKEALLLFNVFNEFSKDNLQSEIVFNAIDLGCGTGNCGKLFKNGINISYLQGIDISKRMLDIANESYYGENSDLKTYDKLVHKDIIDILGEQSEKFDIVLSSGALQYNSDLEKIIALVRKNVAIGGYFAFSVPSSRDEEIKFDYIGGGFSYHQDFLEKVAIKLGYEVKKIVLCSNATLNDTVCCVLKNPT